MCVRAGIQIAITCPRWAMPGWWSRSSESGLSYAVRVFVDRCQTRFTDPASDRPTALDDLRRLIATLPATLPLPEQLVVKGVVAKILQRHGGTAASDPVVLQVFAVSDRQADRSQDALVAFIDRLILERPSNEMANLPSCVGAALAVIHRDYRDPTLTLRRVARQVGVSEGHLARAFRTHIGRSFGNHLHQHRLQHARTLLLTTNKPVKEIAYLIGYRHTHGLDAHFSRRLGVTPTQYRKRAGRC